MNPPSPEHFLPQNAHSLLPALLLSASLHLLLIKGDVFFSVLTYAPPKASHPPITATLKTPDISEPLPGLDLKTQEIPVQPVPQKQTAAKKPEKRDPRALSTMAAQSARLQIAAQNLYPEAAVEQGLEGTAWVQIFLDEKGNVIAARLEGGSGHNILDQAALAAVRALKNLPAEGQGEALLPVVFRLKNKRP